MEPCWIIIPTYNRRHILERTIPHYLRVGAPLLVVDDGSQDGTDEWLRGLGVRVVRHERRRGVAAARNTGLKSVDSPWVLFGEDDVLMPQGQHQRLLAAAARLPRVGAVCGLSYVTDTWSLERGTPAAGLLDPTLLLAEHSLEPAGPILLPTLHSRSLINREAALGVGGFDESFLDSAFREESDFFARLWRGGWGCWMVPDTWEVHVRHRLGGGCRGKRGVVPKLFNRWSYWRNDCRFIERHWRLWNHFAPVSFPGTLKARSFANITWRAIEAAWT